MCVCVCMCVSKCITPQVKLSALTEAKFEQCERLDRLITELGGVDVVKADPALLDRAMAQMSHADQITLAISRQNSDKLDAAAAVSDDTNTLVRKLTYDSVKKHADVERIKMQNELLLQQMEHMKAMLASQVLNNTYILIIKLLSLSRMRAHADIHTHNATAIDSKMKIAAYANTRTHRPWRCRR